MSFGKRRRVKWRTNFDGGKRPARNGRERRERWELQTAIPPETWQRTTGTAHDPEQKDDDNERRPSNSN